MFSLAFNHFVDFVFMKEWLKEFLSWTFEDECLAR